MATYLILTLPAYGHVNPTLAIAQELVRRGQNVVYYLPEKFRESVEATGASFRSYHSHLMNRIANLSPMLGEESRLVLPQVLDRIRAEKPDVILHEPVCVWSRIVARVLEVPAISLRPTYAMNEHFNMARLREQMPGDRLAQIQEMLAKTNRDLADICANYGLPPTNLFDVMSYAEPLNIVFLPKAFQPAGDTFDERHLFVGPSILPRHQATDFPLDRLEPTRPLLYISLGTIFNNELAFFKQCVEAFGESAYQVVLSRGKQVDPAALGPIPENFLVAPYVPQLEILSRARLFLTHAGMNSTMESLYYGVPLVAVPQPPEQMVTARQIAEMELGAMLEKEAITSARLCETVERVTQDQAINEHVQQMKQLTREAGGYQRAVDAVIQFTQASHEAAETSGERMENKSDAYGT
jgi:MGT family glycosyltransferase